MIAEQRLYKKQKKKERKKKVKSAPGLETEGHVYNSYLNSRRTSYSLGTI